MPTRPTLSPSALPTHHGIPAPHVPPGVCSRPGARALRLPVGSRLGVCAFLRAHARTPALPASPSFGDVKGRAVAAPPRALLKKKKKRGSET